MPLAIDKMSLVVTTRCDLKCKLCDEFIPQHKPFADMTLDEERMLLNALFSVADYVKLLHLSGGGEPFLHPQLAEMIDIACEYADKFDELMVFTNSTIAISSKLLDAFVRNKEKLIVHCSNYGLMPERSEMLYQTLRENGIKHRITKYYGDDQDYGGWVDFGDWESRNRTADELSSIFVNCGITRIMYGNWRTRDGTVHWCQRSQRGMELGLIPDCPDDYVNLLDDTSIEEKLEKFREIMSTSYLSACNYCSGNHGTDDKSKRFPAGVQL
ncbi:hypothetical protein LQZ18_02520 [Lachnospiraceae bacterium ZAX-1]